MRDEELRPFIATYALQGMLAHPTRYKPREGAPANWHEAIAEEAVQLADAMLAALKPKTIALMHGPSFKGDGGAALTALATYYANGKACC